MNSIKADPSPRAGRARFLRLAAGATALAMTGRLASAAPPTPRPAPSPMHRRIIPSSAESLPVIGLGTWQGFDVDPGSAEYRQLPAVLQALFDAGGSVIDSSPMYGRSEAVAGALLASAKQRNKAFLATKVWTPGRDEGIRQMNESRRLLQSERIDLMQIHNLVDWRTQLATLRDWKSAGKSATSASRTTPPVPTPNSNP